jgi:exosortase A
LQFLSSISTRRVQGSGPLWPLSQAANVFTTDLKNRRSALFLLTLSLAILGLLFWRTFAGMFSLWQFGAYSHGYLIFPISAYLVWQRRHRVWRAQPSTSLWALLMVAGLAVAWLVGELADANLIRQSAVVALIPALVCTVMGGKYARLLLFPLLFLFFAIPAGDSLIPRLQDFTAWFTVSGLRLTGIPALLEGRRIYISSGIWEVAEACSGIRYLISSVALGALFAHIIYKSWVRRLLFVGASILVPIIANGVRAYTIVLLAHKVDPKLAVGIDHVIYGWVFFTFVILLLFMLGFKWHELQPDKPDVRTSVEPGEGGPTPPVYQRRRLFATCSVILILTVTAAAARRLNKPQSVNLSYGSPLQTVFPWRSREIITHNELLKNSYADFVRTSAFTDGEHSVSLALKYCVSQSAQTHLLDSLNEQFAAAGWSEINEHPREIVLSQNSLQVVEVVLTNGSKKRLLWSWYWVDGQFTANPSVAKLLRAKAKLLRKRQDSAQLILLAEFNSSPAEAASILKDFLEHSHITGMLESFSR